MGNGADKLIRRFLKYNITISDFFASDGFVRGHSFHGKRVKSFSEIRDEYPEFVIVLSFASNRGEVIDMLEDIDAHYDMYVPDMPVSDESEYFDREFYNTNYDAIAEAYNSIEDDISRDVYSSVVNYKLSGRLSYLSECWSSKGEEYALLSSSRIRCAVDAGAYNGDTAREMKEWLPHLEMIYAIEPDTKNFKKLTKYCEAESEIRVVPLNAAAWCENSNGDFCVSGNRNSSVNSTASYEHVSHTVDLVRIDSLPLERIDYIKYDVEGAECEALRGSSGVIERDEPDLLVSLYHRSRDLFSIVNLIHTEYPRYAMYIRRTRCIPAWEIDLILTCKRKHDNDN
jgi:FkbM family methyltransferase